MDTLDKLQSMLDDSSVKTTVLLVGDMNTVLPQTTELNRLIFGTRKDPLVIAAIFYMNFYMKMT